MLSRFINTNNSKATLALISRSYGTSTEPATKKPATSPFERITVIGAGLMGSGIAQVSAMAKHQVNLVDVSEDSLNRGQGYILKSLKRIAKKNFPDNQTAQISFTEDVLSRIEFTTKTEDAASKSDLVVEAVIENIELKQKIFTSVSAVTGKDTILASNTSSLPIKDIFVTIPQEKLQFTAGLHFFNPVPQMKLVEIVKTEHTSEDTFSKLYDYTLSLKKAPVACKDTPGFIVNRLLVPYMMEAVRMLERGDATAKDIDTAMKLGAGYPMGPFELLDYVGLDTVSFVVGGWNSTNKEMRESGLSSPSKILDDLVKSGRLGIKSGEGFYKYK
ncbi:hypothetical protein BB559_005773 [Furculomyces boomerangus]|uniref:3-hydroxyacyl-CoA dehydrogenase n=2 Tax=Harpellales TaxID=61421 RepID=A0A2T9Y6Q2_9FUNG|nr:hypothetical protein BB559_005773 [Furculomyces boomerangus]PVZ97410.1 hypothetical protein BB558_006623 [Smittium angustum]PVZ99010.1 hypothetical protein BB558_004987 [Smittium angustum]